MAEFFRSVRAEVSHVLHPTRWGRRDWTAAWTGFAFGLISGVIYKWIG